MQRCPELEKLTLQNYEKENSGEVQEVARNSYSRQDGVIIIGTDPNEWFEGYDSIFLFYPPTNSAKIEIKVEVLKAYCEGSVGWVVDQVTTRLPNGVKLNMRHTRIYHQENNTWKIVHNHTSIGVPNGSLGEYP